MEAELELPEVDLEEIAFQNFDSTEYRKWMEEVTDDMFPKLPIRLSSELNVYYPRPFIAGRLNHIDAFKNYREPGNTVVYTKQLVYIRKQIEEKQNGIPKI